MKKTSLLFAFLAFLFTEAVSNPGDTVIAKKKYFTQRLNGTIEIDGIPNEATWEAS